MAYPFNRLLMGTATLLLAYYYDIYKNEDFRTTFPLDATIEQILPQGDEYDFIIVGGGTAGCVVAERLSLKYHVLVLEYGGNPLPLTKAPFYFHFTNYANETSHPWWSVPQNHSGFAYENHKIYIAQGKALGGSSTINGFSYNRGSPHDYDLWANMTGDDSWKYENLLKYFKMNENFHHESVENDHVGHGGPLVISKNEAVFNDKELEMLRQWRAAGIELGYGDYDNPNFPQKQGYGTLSITKRFGRRISSYDAFLKPAEERTTLTIHRYSEVKQIEFDENLKATGVTYLRHGVAQHALVRKEVIVSAGALNSPLVLMRSGIGPKLDLDEAGIPVIADLPVGERFQDHPGVMQTVLTNYDKELHPYDVHDIQEFIHNGRGPLANHLGIVTQSFIISEEAKKETNLDWPDIHFIGGFNSTQLTNGDSSYWLYIGVGRPTSYGTVKLNTTDPYNSPLIWNPNYLASERDIKCLIEGYKIAIKTFETKAMKDFGGKSEFFKTPIPECAQFPFGSDECSECIGRHVTCNIWHPTCTCPMGSDDDPYAVLDSKLRVRKVKGVRVCDNSIMPKITNANTQSPAMMIGQKCADLVFQEYPDAF